MTHKQYTQQRLSNVKIARRVTEARPSKIVCGEAAIRREKGRWQDFCAETGNYGFYDPDAIQKWIDVKHAEQSKGGRPAKLKGEPLLYIKLLILLFARQGVRGSSRGLALEYGVDQKMCESAIEGCIKYERKEGSILHYFLRHQGKKLKILRMRLSLQLGERKVKDLPQEIKDCLVCSTWETDRIAGPDHSGTEIEYTSSYSPDLNPILMLRRMSKNTDVPLSTKEVLLLMPPD